MWMSARYIPNVDRQDLEKFNKRKIEISLLWKYISTIVHKTRFMQRDFRFCKENNTPETRMYFHYFHHGYFQLNAKRRNGILLPKSSDLLWEKIVLKIEKKIEIRGWRPRICNLFKNTLIISQSEWPKDKPFQLMHSRHADAFQAC